jgi:hypothetical protein
MEFENVTIAIPLHRSLKFKDIILRNIEKLIGRCNIIISDCTEEDTLLKHFETSFEKTAFNCTPLASSDPADGFHLFPVVASGLG